MTGVAGLIAIGGPVGRAGLTGRAGLGGYIAAMDVHALYRNTQARVVALVGTCPSEVATIAVAGTPAWTVTELISHLCGVASDISNGRVDGVATPPWTARQIAERRGRSMDQLLAEWAAVTPAILGLLAVPGRADAAAFDLITHEHDLRGALGMAGPSDGAAVAAVTTRVAARVGGLIDAAGLPALRLVGDASGWECLCGSGKVGVAGQAANIEWFRALMGRRSAAQIATYQWDGDPVPYFEMFNLFGSLPEVPVVEAGAPVA